MLYADWSWYSGTFKGAEIAEADFDRLIIRASAMIDNFTLNRAATYYPTNPLPLQHAACAVAEVIQRFDRLSRGTDAKPIVTETNDGFSQTYAQPLDPDSVSGQQAFQARAYAAAKMYMSWTGLLYTGVTMYAHEYRCNAL
jgi:hypothetical protein